MTAPHGTDLLSLVTIGRTAAGLASESATEQIKVVADPGSWIAGSVVAGDGKPVAGATVTWRANGLSADYYTAGPAPASMRDMEAREPSRRDHVSALNFPNPRQVFGRDPIGVGLGASYAARFHGEILADMPGAYQFVLRAHHEAQLLIDGVMVAQVNAGGEFSDATGVASLSQGSHTIEVRYCESGGATALQLFWTKPGGTQEVVPPWALLTGASPVPAVTGDDGRFRLNVPASLDGVRVETSAGSGSSIVLDGTPQSQRK